jgi:hypothetical protein
MLGAADAHPYPADRSTIHILWSALLRTPIFFRKQSFETDVLSGEKKRNVRRVWVGTARPFAMDYV